MTHCYIVEIVLLEVTDTVLLPFCPSPSMTLLPVPLIISVQSRVLSKYVTMWNLHSPLVLARCGKVPVRNSLQSVLQWKIPGDDSLQSPVSAWPHETGPLLSLWCWMFWMCLQDVWTQPHENNIITKSAHHHQITTVYLLKCSLV